MTLPTQLTLLRILLTFLIMGLVFVPGLPAKAWALGLFMVAGLTDWLDGFLARRLKQVSALGILLDPIADKVLVLGIMLAFVQLMLIRAWMLLVIVLRELLITGVRLYAASRHIVIPAAQEGKHKTISQMLTLTLILTLLVVRETRQGHELAAFQQWMEPAILVSMWITVALTVISGVSFFWRNRVILADELRQGDRHRR